MVKKAILLLSAAAALAGGTAKAQKMCGSDEVYNKMKASDPKVAYYESLLEQQIQRQLNGMDLSKFARATGSLDDTLYDIPLVFHIIHDYGNEYISDNDVYAAVDDINRYYAKQNPDTSGIITPYKGVVPNTYKWYIGKSYMQFHLATKDPQGNPSHGITRRRSNLTVDGGDWAKYDQWSPKNYINIWVVNAMPNAAGGSAAAYAVQPAGAAANPYTDGVIALFDYVYAAAPTNYKGTLAHELGHIMNLSHPWGNNNQPDGPCGDDGVDDTPPTTGHYKNGCVSSALYDTTCTTNVAGIQKDSIKLKYIPVSDTFTNRGISFIAYDTFKLRSVTFYPRNNNDSFKIGLMKGNTIIDSFTTVSNIVNAEAQVANVNFTVLKDTVNPYTLVFLKNRGAYHDSAFGTYPKTLANTVTIQNDVTNGRYNYFYNWKVVNSPDSAFIGKPALGVLPGILTNKGMVFNNPTRLVINSVKFYSKDTVGAPYQILLQKKQGAGSYSTINTYNGTVTRMDSVITAPLGFTIAPSAKTDSLRLVFGVNPRAMRDSASNGLYTSSIPGAIKMFNDQDAAGNYNYFYSWSVSYGYYKLYTYAQMTALYMKDSVLANGADTLVRAFNLNDSVGNNGLYLVDYPDTVNSQNIMDYTYCTSRMFSNGQVVRMRAALTNSTAYRNNLYTAQNLSTTGALAPRPDLAPTADFSISKTSGLEKIHVDKAFGAADGAFTFQFTDRSWNDTITARSWTFSNNATSGTSTASVVSNQFKQSGWVTASLTVTGNNNNGATGTITRPRAVYAADTTPMSAIGYYQDFTNADTAKWPIFNYYNNNTKWEIYNGAGVYDNTCIRYNNFDARTGLTLNEVPGTPRGDVDDYFTPAFDLTDSKYTSNCNFTFMSAGAFRTNNPADMRDTLEIFYSVDNANSWKSMATFGKFTLANNGTVSTSFVPNNTQWSQQGVVIPAAAKTHRTFFRIRYRPGVFNNYGLYLYDSLIGSGNNFYMDRINISSYPLGINEAALAQNGVSLAPNPTSGNTSVVVKGGIGNAMIQVTDIAGKVVYTTQQQLNSGDITRIEIPGNNISVKGIYLVHVVTDNINRTEKLVVY